MPIPVLAAAAAVGVAMPLLGWALLSGRQPEHRRVQANLTRGLAPIPAPGATASSATGPVRAGLTAFGQRLAGLTGVTRLERHLTLAGRPPAWSVSKLVAAKWVLALAAGLLALLVVGSSPGAFHLLLAVVIVVVAFFVPDLLMRSRGQERQAAIQLELADTLDQMTIAVEAGLGFESAMARAAENGRGPLAQELTRTLQDMRLGMVRRDAYLALSERTTVVDLRRFLRAMIQADAFGVSITGVLRTQAAEMRMKRRQRAEEKAMQIPVKVIFPLMLTILPVLFIVLLGPAMLDIVHAFTS